LDTIHAEDLQRNAARVGAYLKSQLREKIASKYDCVGDIRGLGLFLGVEFIRTDSDKDCSINNNDSADADAKRIEDVVIDVKAGAKVEEKTEKTEAVAEEAEAEAEAEGMSREEQIKPNADLTKFIVCHLLLSDLEEDSGSSPYQEDKSKVVRIIVSSDGPDENVIKIKPPLVFSMEDADVLVSALDRALQAAAAAASATASTVNPVELSC
jgi:4-aminobutyrate aminotransferase-like enzyme